jgi:cyclopropane-fatty-acyl-phospholipid synthase
MTDTCRSHDKARTLSHAPAQWQERSLSYVGGTLSLASVIHDLIGSPPDIAVAAYDGSAVMAEPSRAELRINRPEALVRVLARPGELGLVRAIVSGDLEVTGDLFHALETGLALGPRSVTPVVVARLVRAAGPDLARHLWPLPEAPPEEARIKGGRLHSLRRDAESIVHHYDVSNRFYELVLGPSMTYSCAVFDDPDESLEAAQERKIELICRKLDLRPGARLLDVGCGWGQLLIHAARHHGVNGVGITISPAQAQLAAARVAEAGLSDRVEIRLQDYRTLAGETFDAISSVGMFEHVGSERAAEYFTRLYGLLAPRGRLLNHAISAAGGSRLGPRSFMARYVFPDGELIDVGEVVLAMERAGFEVRDVESLREHYARTLRAWVANLEAGWDRAVALAGMGRARVWRLYMAASRLGFERNNIQLHQVLGVKLAEHGAAGMPLRPDWGS